MNNLLRNPRFYVIVFSFLLSLGFYVWVRTLTPEGTLQIIKLTQYYALTAVFYLYITLLTTPLTRLFLSFPFRAKYIIARRALGFSTFYFAFLHACLAFFGQLGGFAGLWYLDSSYLFAIILSFTALIILSLMAATSFDKMVSLLTFPRWKFLHRFVYLAAVLILIHALLLGTHFTTFNSPIAVIGFFMVTVLSALDAIRFDTYLKQRFAILPQIGVFTTACLCALFAFVAYSTTNSSISPVGIHSQHLQELTPTDTMLSMPGMTGDKKLRYSVNLQQPNPILSGKDVTFTLQVNDAANGNLVMGYNILYEKLMHIIIVDNSLTYFHHVHPTFENNTFSLTTQFPKDGRYRMYLNFQPFGAIEQQFAFTIPVGNITTIATAPANPQKTFSKTVDSYTTTLTTDNPLTATDLSTGRQKIHVNITDATSKKPVTNLKPYLGAFGHMTMINITNYSFMHVHPAALITNSQQTGGPTVDFLPLSLQQTFTPGIYRVFVELNPDNHLTTFDYAVEIK